jgi:hypothetical protein
MVFLDEIPVEPKPNKLPEALGEMDTIALSEHIMTRSIEFATGDG